MFLEFVNNINNFLFIFMLGEEASTNITIQEAIPYIWTGIVIIGIIMGILNAIKKKRGFFIVMIAIMLFLALVVYDGKSNFSQVFLMGASSFIAYGIAFGVSYLILKRKKA